MVLIHAETYVPLPILGDALGVGAYSVHPPYLFCSPRYLCCSSLRQLGHNLEVLYCVVFVLHDDLESSLPERRDEVGPRGVGTGLVPFIVDAKQALLMMTIRGRPLWYPWSCLDIAS